eukprot:6337285-Alexandrium_andersonii.AAC.1
MDLVKLACWCCCTTLGGPVLEDVSMGLECSVRCVLCVTRWLTSACRRFGCTWRLGLEWLGVVP